MIVDTISNSGLYTSIGTDIAKAFHFIQTNDMMNIPSGKYEIEGDKIFVLVQEYETKDKKEGKLEGHKKYLDVQYVIFGSEQIGVSPLKNQQAIETKLENDITFYEGNASFILLEAGMFAIFFPGDLHMPGIAHHKKGKVKKAVVKVQVG